MIEQDELHEILTLHREGLSISAISRRLRRDRKTVHKYIRSGETQVRYIRKHPRPSKLACFDHYLRNRVSQYPELTAVRLLRELRNMGYTGSASILKEKVRGLRRQSHANAPHASAGEFVPPEMRNTSADR